MFASERPPRMRRSSLSCLLKTIVPYARIKLTGPMTYRITGQLPLPLLHEAMGLQRREVVEIGPPQLTHHWVIDGLKQRHLQMVPIARCPAGRSLAVGMLRLEVGQYFHGTLRHSARHAGELRYMDAVAFIGGARHDFVEEHHLAVPFFDGHVEIC
jgi:hypothetical protein